LSTNYPQDSCLGFFVFLWIRWPYFDNTKSDDKSI